MGPVFALVYVQAFDAQMHTDALIAATALLNQQVPMWTLMQANQVNWMKMKSHDEVELNLLLS